MRSDEFEAFAVVIADLCAAYDRPATDERKRAFWETLKHFHLHDLKRSAAKWRDTNRKMPSPVDLKPERATAPPAPVDTGPPMSRWAVAANRILLAVAYCDERRGFKPIAVWEPMPPNGWGLPLRLPKLIDGSLLDRVLAIKADYVRMAEQDDAAGEPWDHIEFNRMCREGFEKLLGTQAGVTA
jgi:hypothetical protein